MQFVNYGQMEFIKKITIFGVLTLIILLASCGRLDEDGIYYSKQNTMVCAFSLQKDTSVLSNLDSIFFTIDLDRSVIYNADSLPKGTDISAIAVKATFMNPANVYVNYEDEDGATKSFSYLATSQATIDFRKCEENKVKMKVIAADGHTSQTYTLKVNVHKVVADSLYWKKIESTTLPVENKNIASSKCVSTNSGYYLFAQDVNGALSVYRTLNFTQWEEKSNISMPAMDWRSLIYDGSTLYVMSADSKLYSCSDLENIAFSESSVMQEYTPISLIGVYESKLLAVVKEGESYNQATIDVTNNTISLSSMPEEFPIKGFSQPITFTSKWTRDQLVIACGEKRDGSLTNAVWGYDGSRWAILNNAVSGGSLITPRTGVVMFTYYTYEYNSEIDLHTKVLTYFIIGGWDGTKMTNDLYYTTNLGGKWKKADATSPMALPSEIAPRMGADVFVLDAPVVTESYGRGPVWRDIELMNTRNITRLMSLKADEVQEAPFVFMVGGSSSLEYSFINEVWKGVIWRLTFPPIP